MDFVVFFFFFQAEDGIRDGTVTGVQTCALPILGGAEKRSPYQARPKAAISSRVSPSRSEEHTSELQSQFHLVCRLLLEKKKKKINTYTFCKTKKKTNN